jgi:hypothetical protein
VTVNGQATRTLGGMTVRRSGPGTRRPSDARYMVDQHGQHDWFCVRTVLKFSGSHLNIYEERLTLWAVPDVEEAVETAEQEARGYADSISECTYVGLAQAYQLPESPGHGAEVFSLMRDSALEPDAYLNTFFDTGTERQGNISTG